MTTEPTATPSWGRFDAEGGAGVVGRGPTIAECFAQAVLAMFAAITDLGAVEPRDVREVRAHADTLDALLVHCLDECLYVHDVEGFVACQVEFAAVDEHPRPGGEPFRLHGVLRGEVLDPARHRRGASVAGILARGATVSGDRQGFQARAVLDIR